MMLTVQEGFPSYVRIYSVIQKITAANDSPHSEAPFARLIGACELYVAPTGD
jgi:hypothetical protein